MEKFKRPAKTRVNIGRKRSLIKGMKRFIVYVGTQRTVVILLLLAQVGLLFYMFLGIERNYAKAQIVFSAACFSDGGVHYKPKQQGGV